jgi:hypothetical protein
MYSGYGQSANILQMTIHQHNNHSLKFLKIHQGSSSSKEKKIAQKLY